MAGAGALSTDSRRARLTHAAFVLGCGVYVVGLLVAKALTSLAPALLLLAAAAQPGAGERVRQLRHNGPALAMIGIYPLILLSGFWTENFSEWRHLLTRYLPFLILPLAFTLAQPLRGRERYYLGVGYVGLTTLVALGTVAKFLGQYERQQELIQQSKNITAITGIFHIHFGMMMALAAFFAVALAKAAPHYGRGWHRAALLGSTGFLAVALHLLAYRTGTLVLYAMLAVTALRYLFTRPWLGLGLVLTLVLTPLVAYYTLQPVRHRVANTLYDYERFRTGQDINDYSIAQRLAAWTNATTLIGHHWLAGVGPADVEVEMQRQYERRSFNLRPENRVLLHNQYLFALLALGVPGLLWLLAMLFGPLSSPCFRQDFCAIVFLTGLGAAMLVDTPFSLHIGRHLFLFLYALLLVEPRHRTLVFPAAGPAQPTTEQSGIGNPAPSLRHPTSRPGIYPG